MYLEKIKIKNFRNIENIEICPEKNINVIAGKNAQGKTNIIEAIWLFTGVKSFRGAKDDELKRINGDGAVLSCSFTSLNVSREAKITILDKRTAYLNDKKLSSPLQLSEKFQAIVFSPTDLRLVKDGPALRRHFLDVLIGKLCPAYVKLLIRYNRQIKQRNKILKDFRVADLTDVLSGFDEELIKTAEKIEALRREYVSIIDKYAVPIYGEISKGSEKLTISFKPSYSGSFADALKGALKTDIMLCTTSVGPHRDDIDFFIDGLFARSYASQGQQRSIAIALKLAEANVIKEKTGEYPIALLDDVFSELDELRQDYILNHIKDWQVFITACDPSNVKRLNEGKVIKVDNGETV